MRPPQSVLSGSFSNSESTRVSDFGYTILAGIDAVLTALIRSSNRAVLMYPNGTNENGSAAMRIRLYGKAAEDQAAAE